MPKTPRFLYIAMKEVRSISLEAYVYMEVHECKYFLVLMFSSASLTMGKPTGSSIPRPEIAISF